ncbi:MAG TPA: hypothetical protein VK203_14300 [Nostocaceae cyanobacterium]|nr:hypothetical protein [Nostocaceae cyanobacterium]
MGEAKRRKLTDPNYGKIRNQVYSNKVNIFDWGISKYQETGKRGVVAYIGEDYPADYFTEDSEFINLADRLFLPDYNPETQIIITFPVTNNLKGKWGTKIINADDPEAKFLMTLLPSR